MLKGCGLKYCQMTQMRRFRTRKWLQCISVIGLIWLFWPIRYPKAPLSTAIFSEDGTLLSATVACDGQWRFEKTDTLNPLFISAIIAYEDQRFYRHCGFDVRALARAAKQNFASGRIVSGGSTITMQVARMLLGNQKRTHFQKIKEIIYALRLEAQLSKEEILLLYANLAPYGGNIVGIEAASWRYFGKAAKVLSWADAATLAVLPNSPSLMHPGKQAEKLQYKRNRLLDRLYTMGDMDAMTHQTALIEPMPDRPSHLPNLAPHLLSFAKNQKELQGSIYTTVNAAVQRSVLRILNHHHHRMTQQEIYNAAVLVVDNTRGAVVAYVGNTNGSPQHYNDMVQAGRSSGSILKPFLYHALITESEILPHSLLRDIPFSDNDGGEVPSGKSFSPLPTSAWYT